MSDKNGKRIELIGRERMTIGPEAAEQIIDHYSHIASRPIVREAIRKWNANETSKSLTESALFDVFREIERKSFGI